MEHFGSVLWYLGVVKALPTAIQSKIQKQKAVFFVLFFLVFLFCPSLQSPHRHRHEEHIMLQTRSAAGALCRRRAAPQARRSQQDAARGTSEARVTSAHPQGRVTGVLMRTAGNQRARCEQSVEGHFGIWGW